MKQLLRKIAKRLYTKIRPAQHIHTPPPPEPKPQKEVRVPPPTPVPEIVINITETPNPNACKYDTPHQVSEKAFSYTTQNIPQDHPLAQKILAVPEIQSIFGVGNFITVTKSSQAEWTQIHNKVERILQEHFAAL